MAQDRRKGKCGSNQSDQGFQRKLGFEKDIVIESYQRMKKNYKDKDKKRSSAIVLRLVNFKALRIKASY